MPLLNAHINRFLIRHKSGEMLDQIDGIYAVVRNIVTKEDLIHIGVLGIRSRTCSEAKVRPSSIVNCCNNHEDLVLMAA